MPPRTSTAAIPHATAVLPTHDMNINPRGKATSTGYRDINMSVKFRGHVCEIQIQLAAMLEVKHDQVHPRDLRPLARRRPPAAKTCMHVSKTCRT